MTEPQYVYIRGQGWVPGGNNLETSAKDPWVSLEFGDNYINEYKYPPICLRYEPIRRIDARDLLPGDVIPYRTGFIHVVKQIRATDLVFNRIYPGGHVFPDKTEDLYGTYTGVARPV